MAALAVDSVQEVPRIALVVEWRFLRGESRGQGAPAENDERRQQAPDFG